MTELQRLQQELADSVARSDIECFAAPKTVRGERWYVIPEKGMLAVGMDPKDLEKAVRYLELRRLLKRWSTNPRQVQLISE